MKAKVTEDGVVVPKELFDGADEVDIRKENNLIVIVLKNKVGFAHKPKRF